MSTLELCALLLPVEIDSDDSVQTKRDQMSSVKKTPALNGLAAEAARKPAPMKFRIWYG